MATMSKYQEIVFSLFHTYRECEEVEQWIAEKEMVAANEELGKDLEHVEVLQKRFSDFVHNVLASEDRVIHVSTLADTLLEANHAGKLCTTFFCCFKQYSY